MALIAASLRAAFRDVSRPLQYSLMLFVAALFALVGGYFMGGLAIVPYDIDVAPALTAAFIVFIFSYIFVWYACELSESLGHRAYLSREEFLVRGFRVFLLWFLSYVVVFLLYSYLPPALGGLIAFFVTLLAVYASVVAAIDGYTISGAFRESLAIVRDQLAHVAEFVVFSVLLLLPVFLVDAVLGFFGAVLAVMLVTFVVIPWLTAHAVLTYLYRYPIVVAALSKLEGL